ncbi:class I SAM-dependent methyltransferase [Kaistella palustris]|uniref:class I SAM-dependent methyltransferase n=1 Tax=Kaistella palustris TaxID=493376 RepID=UPI00040279FD|nr:class I SAM-dependent methyltransferase [Kaistella palustris]
MKQEEISGFYDEFVQRQLKIGANERLISLYKRLLALGLKEESSVLELGCGVGIFTRLLSKKISKGFIEAVDLSGKSVAVAKSELQAKKNIHFDVADVVVYKPKHPSFDFITLMDVIEHIPLEHHAALFANLAGIAGDKTRIAINIPNPQYIAYARAHHPESLQVIDQEVELFPLMKHWEDHGLELVFFEKYGIWEAEDYHFMVLRKKQKFQLKHLADERSLAEKAVHKFTGKIDGLKYR